MQQLSKITNRIGICQRPAPRITSTTFEQLVEHFKGLQSQVSKFEYELEHCETYQRIAFNLEYFYGPGGFTRRIAKQISSTYMNMLNRELKVINERANVLEIKMYCDLITKCVTFGEMMMERLEKMWQSTGKKTDEIIPEMIAGPLRNKDPFSDRMEWTILKINLVVERIMKMMISNVQKMTGVERRLIKQDVSQELRTLATTFLWLVLKDQKSYELVFPTGKEIRVGDDVKAMSYIDQHPLQCEYCTNIVRCTITPEVEDYLSGHLTHGMGPEVVPETITRRSSCILSRAQMYAKALNKILAFLKEMNDKIDAHTMECLSPARAPEGRVGDDVRSLSDDSECDITDRESLSPAELSGESFKNVRASAIPGAVFDVIDIELPSPAQTRIYSFKNVGASAIPDAVFNEIDPEPEPLSPHPTSMWGRDLRSQGTSEVNGVTSQLGEA